MPRGSAAILGSPAISPHRPTQRPAAWPAVTVARIERSTAGSSGSYRWAIFALPRSIASVYWMRSFDPIEKNATRVSQIIENVLQLSRRDATRQERLVLGDWITGFVDEFQQTLQLDPATVRPPLEPDAAPLEVHFDPSHLHQVMWNLCENAMKHGMSGGSGRIDLRMGRIASTGRPFLEVADRGTGIDEVHTERTFEPFFPNGPGGSGLGLFIARGCGRTNGALLLYGSRAGGGSIFRVIFADPQRWEW